MVITYGVTYSPGDNNSLSLHFYFHHIILHTVLMRHTLDSVTATHTKTLLIIQHPVHVENSTITSFLMLL